jgi:hypothetical protein
MADWTLITQTVETALSMSAAERNKLLKSGSLSESDQKTIHQLVQRSRNGRNFLATSADEGEHPSDYAVLRAGQQIGPWSVVSLLGRGGMGEVWKARRADGLYEQDIALKVMQPGDAARAARFDLERRRLARMEHPGIARIVDGGITADNLPWIAMEFVDGQPIDDAVEGWSLSRKLAKFVQLCDAVQHAHSRLVLHRDIKPSNVLVDAAGAVRLIDFGIASDLEEEEAGGPLTVRTAAPEQLLAKPVSAATDIWALGVLLHLLVAGAYPERRSDGSVELAARAIGSADIRAILSRALCADPGGRYTSASAFGADVNAFLKGLPVEARSGGAVYRLGKAIQRYPLSSAFAGVAVLALAIGLGVSLTFAERARAGEAQAVENLARAEFFADRSEHFAYAREAYANALQHMFGNGADVETQTTLLMGVWSQAYNQREQDPNTAAYMSFSLGRQFMERNDYQTARTILEPWVTERFGPETFLVQGQILLAIVYKNLGLSGEALELFSEVERTLAATYDANSPDHVSAVTQIAELTRTEEDASRAETVLLEAMGGEHAAEVKAFFLGQLHIMRRIRRDLAGARAALIDLEQLVENSPQMDIGDRDLARIQILNFEYFYGGDVDRMRRLVIELVVNSRAQRGENRETGRALIVSGLMAADNGDYIQALEDISEGIALIERFAGPSSGLLVNARLASADVHAMSGRYEEARRIVDRVAAGLDATAAAGWAGQRLIVSRSYLAARQAGPAAGRAVFTQAGLEVAVFREDVILRHGLRRLEALGVNLD